MGPSEFLCGYEGRISRGLFNAAVLGLGSLVALADWFVIDVAHLVLPIGLRPMLFVLVVVFGGAAAAAMFAAVAAKRFHDIGRPGGEILPSILLPVAGLLLTALLGGAPILKFAFLALLADTIARLSLLAGEEGDNAYGRDPLERIRFYETA